MALSVNKFVIPKRIKTQIHLHDICTYISHQMNVYFNILPIVFPMCDK